MDYIRVYCGNELIKQLELDEGRATIGRTEDNAIVLPDAGVSRQHAAIEYENGDYFIVDTGSQNGVFLNKERIERQRLKYWDEIQIHNFLIKFMAKPGFGETKNDEAQAPADLESDKTKFFKITDEKQLDSLRQKTKQCYLSYKDQSGESHKLIIKKPRIIIGTSKNADIKINGWFAPSVAATIERSGSSYELVPSKRGKVIYQSRWISEPAKLVDGSGFLVRDIEFMFFNRLTKTS
jgi:pSer/pThr/pTyr-binding forkhead associated (FHA) protein